MVMRWGELMNEEIEKSPFHPARWKIEKVQDDMSDAERAWVAWLRAAVWRGGFTSLGQACREMAEPDRTGRGALPSSPLGVGQTTLSRWLRGMTLPAGEEPLDEALAGLNGRIGDRRREDADAPGLITAAEVAEGKRLLSVARKAKFQRLQPAQCRCDELQRSLAKDAEELSKMKALRDHLSGQLAEANRTSDELVQRLRVAAETTEGLQDDLDRAQRRMQQLEEQLETVEAALVKWQERYDRLHAEYEIALEAAQAERLAMQDQISELRAALWLSQHSQQRPPASPHVDAEDANLPAENPQHPHERLRDEERDQWVEEVAQGLIALRNQRRERDQLLRTICADTDRDGIYLLAMRLGEEPGIGPDLARKLMQWAGVRYYNPSEGEPSALRQRWADMRRIRLEPRPLLPRTSLPYSSDDHPAVVLG
jgi:hypothetical protein